MTATPEAIVWVAINIVGLFIWSWLALISWERRIAILIDKKSLLRKSRLQTVNRQVKNRILAVILHIVAIGIGLLPIFGIIIPLNGTPWVLISIVTAITAAATMNLYSEFH